MKINILGSEWNITEADKNADVRVADSDGICDKTTREIIITKPDKDCDLGNWEAYRKKVMRHEIIHAFLFESGLHENFTHPQFGHDELYVDWIAVQFPKMQEVFGKAGCL